MVVVVVVLGVVLVLVLGVGVVVVVVHPFKVATVLSRFLKESAVPQKIETVACTNCGSVSGRCPLLLYLV